MKKIFTLIAMAVVAMSAQAQLISFTESDKTTSAGLNAKVFSQGDFSITLVDEVSKMAIDGNNAYFGTADANQKFGFRLKSGAKSQNSEGKRCQVNVTIPSAGTLKIYARTGSNSATDRNVIVLQGESELYNNVVAESDAIKVAGMDADDPAKETNVYPVISVAVAAGQAEIKFPTGSMNFYGFEFVAGGAGIETVNMNVVSEAADAYNLSGQKVGRDYKGVVVKNGKKMLNK